MLILLSFPTFLKGFGKPFAGRETICGGLWVPVQEKQGFPMVFAHFQNAALRRLGRGNFIVRNPFGVCPRALMSGPPTGI